MSKGAKPKIIWKLHDRLGWEVRGISQHAVSMTFMTHSFNHAQSRVTLQYHLCSLAMQCEVLSAPTNGEVFWNTLSVGSNATYTCESGYHLSGNQTRICQSSGLWSGRAPTCTCGQKCKWGIHYSYEELEVAYTCT